jgi:trehalose 6-phosphate synthase
MRASLKIALPLTVSLVLASLSVTAYRVQGERRSLREDLVQRVRSLASGLRDKIEPLEGDSRGELTRLLELVTPRERVKNIAVYGPDGRLVASTHDSDDETRTRPDVAEKAAKAGQGVGEFVQSGNAHTYSYAVPVYSWDGVPRTMAVWYDATSVEAQVSRTLRDWLLFVTVQLLVTVPIALLLVRWTFTDPLTRMAVWLRTLRVGEPTHVSATPAPGFLDELQHEVTHLARDLGTARATAEREARLRDSHASVWTAERLRVSVRDRLANQPLFVVSNREPYMHRFREGGIEVIQPASGLVTALEPIMLACSGTWIAQGAGSADRVVVDESSRLRVPPDRPSYTLRRVWLTKKEERGYYYGFANEGLWPLCHIAHTRPTFRPDDWADYQAVNRHFADAALEEMRGLRSPMLLVHDYHFALLPRLVKQKRPDARVAIFWHIPWPNPEVFGICPWQRELVDGLIGADLIGFHTQSYCNNFLGTVDRAVEALTEWDRFAVNRRGHVTYVRPYPISVAMPDDKTIHSVDDLVRERASIFQDLGFAPEFLAIGVDRVDYTKGILERFRGIERLLETEPDLKGRITLVQIGAPSRTEIDRYHEFLEEVAAEADRINTRFYAGRWKPIVFLRRHHSHQEISRFYRAADVCLVTSLHDGMNLVSKEFVAARDDDRGVLILSTFTGAALELTDALLVNPYDAQQLADALHRAIFMSADEQARRMRRMRQTVSEHNIYRWASHLLEDLANMRVEDENGKDATRDDVGPPAAVEVA